MYLILIANKTDKQKKNSCCWKSWTEGTTWETAHLREDNIKIQALEMGICVELKWLRTLSADFLNGWQ
jgi:hypothetical protein